ncbi:unnamed protein product [Didymodactylos carnosus]|uniref:ADP ribosyltransferase domain-containing protein n=1 Tax=Didymodactylos carnosus TaxID=1234261 RepID=A0A814NC60_9BILA|nr:unnamed protein product [Didymodactylos carnosus]CAF1091524.1 unnamed protein product [Didymodactylos carnosus]CAF3562473.1 unnamed protein product [Didymodactylos carnosus]CAF3856996.1 unnamed protein product [Didymodactylos carnosus]
MGCGKCSKTTSVETPSVTPDTTYQQQNLFDLASAAFGPNFYLVPEIDIPPFANTTRDLENAYNEAVKNTNNGQVLSTKIKAVVTTSEYLINKISQDQTLRQKIENTVLPFNVYDPTEQTHMDLGSENNKFMWFQLLTEVLIRMRDEDASAGLNELILICQRQYSGNPTQQDIIDELEWYESRNAVWWYTRDTFIYKTLNRALRKQDFETLWTFCFLIRDLYKQLKEKRKFTEPIVYVYRGQLMSLEELEKLKINENKFISVNTFFSTTRERTLALVFAGAGTHNTDANVVSVLFEIEVETQLEDAKPFADISVLSDLGPEEKEVLFMFGSVFKIVNISRNEDEKLWIIKLVLAGQENKELKPVFESMKNEIPQKTDLLVLGGVFRNMGKSNEAEKYYQRLLNSLSETDPNVSRCYENLENIAMDKGDYDTAYSYCTKALELQMKSPTGDLSVLASTYTHLGIILRSKRNYHEALENFSNAAALLRHAVGEDHLDIAMVYNNVANLYTEQKNYDLALSYFNKCLQIRMKLLPENHPEIASILTNLGVMHEVREEYELAMSSYDQALKIRLACTPDSYLTAVIYNNIGNLYRVGYQNYSEALLNYEKAFKMYQNASLPSNHPYVYANRNNIDLVKRQIAFRQLFN